MPAKSKLEEIESREGRPMAAILADLYREYGKQKEVARALGVSQPTVSSWLTRLSLQETTILIPRQRNS
jgi:DNA-binding MarR family transcriptional regulator